MRRRGLFGTMARTAVISGTATAVSGNVARKQQAKAQAQAATQPVATPAPSSTDDQIAQLQKLAQLKDQGILTQAEFDAKKAQILGL